MRPPLLAQENTYEPTYVLIDASYVDYSFPTL